ncbi:hypothetical protein SUGI_0919480 [Cryptomeria japonica]|nr:hypothetical protein SUGI_0919480 [Cryptomeria japonica]
MGIRWSSLFSKFYKKNFDGASLGNPGVFGIGCIIKDHKGSAISTGIARIQDGSNNLAEANALLFHVKLALGEQIQNLEIEGGSTSKDLLPQVGR